MDSLIKRFDAERDKDLMIVPNRGIAYQHDMRRNLLQYDAKYLAKCDAYDGTEIGKAVNAGRLALMARHAPGRVNTTLLDYGAGSGAFVRDAAKAGYAASGFDVTAGRARLIDLMVFREDPQNFDVVTAWDTLEHMDNPDALLRNLRKGAHLFASIPVFEDLAKVRESKHYRPGEHLYYFTAKGFTDWMAHYGYRLLETSDHEMKAGRESILAFAFKRDLPDYHDHVEAYKQIHLTKHYGDSATDEYLPIVHKVVKQRQPTSILDYGCGRSDLVAHFWNDGKRRIAKFDPAIGKHELVPTGTFDLVLACDLMEHIPLQDVDRVLQQIRSKGPTGFFAISTILARAKLPDGRNAHCTILSKPEWTRWVASYYGGQCETLEGKHAHELILLTGPTGPG